MPGEASGSVTLNSRSKPPRPQRARRLLQSGVGGFQRQADGADHHREGHHRAGQRRARRGEHQTDAEPVIQQRADRVRESPKTISRQPAGHHRRQHQRQMHESVEHDPGRESGSASAARPSGRRAAGRTPRPAPRRTASAGPRSIPPADRFRLFDLEAAALERRARGLRAGQEGHQLRGRQAVSPGLHHRERIRHRVVAVGSGKMPATITPFETAASVP